MPSIAAENPTAQFAGIYDSREIRDKINRHTGPIYGLVRMNSPERISVLPEFGLELDQEGCRDFGSSVDHYGFKICRLHRKAIE